ncbi:hypothetical protein [Escherichia coli]|uniref:hypothetical protein n=1 Tax=Escherichia coli TaxID=562 RepID=UPI001BAF9621|nr:hypothetical protein [Escherichia coli]
MPRIFINALSAKVGGGKTYINNLLTNMPKQECEIYIASVSYTHLTLPTMAEPCVEYCGGDVIKKKKKKNNYITVHYKKN